jgi:DHA1 family bicyclomycin/chloramphenicol resistance-like MFS transporter
MSKPSYQEFVALSALMISLVAFTSDAMLPALQSIGSDLSILHDNRNQLIISLFFLGLALGQLIYGPLSDRIGRKPSIYLGLAVYIGGCLLCLFSWSFQMMIAGRMLQGIGSAGPRIVIMAMLRDQFESRALARVMSFIMTIFILIPIIAPGVGQLIISFSHWRFIFAVCLMMALIAAIWFALRQPETLLPENRLPISLGWIGHAVKAIVTSRESGGYTIASGLIGGAFLGYLNSSQQIFQQVYSLGAKFPIYFGVLAFSIGFASLFNARMVMRYGMGRLCTWSLVTIIGLSVCFDLVAFLQAGIPPLWAMMLYFLTTFFCTGFLFGNLNALAMEPLGHMAGIGATVVGAASTFLNVLIGTTIGQCFNGTVLPLINGFLLCSLFALSVHKWIERRP